MLESSLPGSVASSFKAREDRIAMSGPLDRPQTFTAPLESESPEQMYQPRYASKYWQVPIDRADRLDTLTGER
jgi:hypothetical protein